MLTGNCSENEEVAERELDRRLREREELGHKGLDQRDERFEYGKDGFEASLVRRRA